ncbi:hypothetical protein LE181_30830 [Streptomyces sp. SCA3-4]|uniref:hypothetical protein n=1 Tax=Streptomyces sichuanensis TaxID=2871810 RepID=UPI001CE356F8|nr:hypothetical protein [Streptomyces sichuanensis]MCA6096542.1 hypothetical protein [Streptomyces sichuanensis]
MRSVRLAPGSRGRERPAQMPAASGARALPWLAGVAAVYAFAQLVLVVPGTGLGWDETVYVSQVDPRAPAAFFSAPRARGVTFLAAPVAALTSSTGVLRVWLAALSGCGLFVSLWVWRRLLPVPVLVVAGALFCGLWVTLFYGPQVMPNLWVAFGALCATGCFLRAARDGSDRRARTGLLLAVAFTALMRPGDAVALVLPLAGAALAVRAWRRPAVLAALAAGVVLGGAEWVVEAYVRYGGLAARLHRAGEIQGGWGLRLALGHHVRALQGRTLCRPCDVPWRHPLTAAWWFALPVLTAGGLVVAARRRCLPEVATPALVAVCVAVPYQLLDYAAPRFLLPVYALLALPVALFLTAVATTVRPPPARGVVRPLGATVLALALLVHGGVQYKVLEKVVSRSGDSRDAFARVVGELHRLGVRPPCIVSGTEAVRIAFRAGCASRQTSGHDGSITAAELVAAAGRHPVAVVVSAGRATPPYARGWHAEPLPPLPGEPAGLRVHLSVPPASGGVRRS